MHEFLRPAINFLGLPEEESRYADAKYVVLPVPYDATTSYNGGTRYGPRAIIEASTQVELFDAQFGLDASQGAAVHTLNEVDPDLSSPEKTVDRIRQVARQLIDDGKFVITLGGEHTVSLGPILALQDAGRGPFTVLQIDAHSDLRADYEGTPYSHACVMRRVHEAGLPILQVGIRAISEDEWAYMEEERIPRDFCAWNLPGGAIDPAAVLAKLGPKVYVTVDVDGFDPAVFPGTGTPEPGGIGWYPFIDLFRAIAREREVVGFDVVEVAPTPPYHACEFAAARLVYKMITALEAEGPASADEANRP